MFEFCLKCFIKNENEDWPVMGRVENFIDFVATKYHDKCYIRFAVDKEL